MTARRFDYPVVHYVLSALLSNILLVGLLAWAVWGLAGADADWRHWMLAYSVPVVLASSFVGLHLPTTVVVDDERLVFRAFGREHAYRWREMGFFQVRGFMLGDRFLVRAGEPGLFRGRYWIHVQMRGYRELRALLEEKQRTLFPQHAPVRPKAPRPQRQG
ncbi:MAG: hypothetical protein M4D85_01315 [Actinomycetota bacterium]|nr:hypothetical protein [Actinomycetota bacterium]